MSTPHRDHGGTPETHSSNHYSMAMQRSGPTDAAEDEGLEYVREALQAGGYGLAYTEPHAATHFVADTVPRGSEVTHSSSLTDVARTDQSNSSRDAPVQGNSIDQSSSIRTMTFQEIAAIIMPKNANSRANLPATDPRRQPNAILARDEISNRGLVVDRAMVYQLIHAGIIPDPAPHYLWDEINPLISWYIDELLVKLNSLLEEENRMRNRTKTLIRRMATNKPPGNQHEDLIKWCRTGGTGTYRRKINFYMYDDWITRLERFDFMEDVQIIDMMVLISEVRHRLHSNPMIALRAPRPPATQQLQPILPKPPTIPPSRSAAPKTKESFTVYRDTPSRTPLQWMPQPNPATLQSRRNLPTKLYLSKMPTFNQQEHDAHQFHHHGSSCTAPPETYEANLMPLHDRTNLPTNEPSVVPPMATHHGNLSAAPFVPTTWTTNMFTADEALQEPLSQPSQLENQSAIPIAEGPSQVFGWQPVHQAKPPAAPIAAYSSQTVNGGAEEDVNGSGSQSMVRQSHSPLRADHLFTMFGDADTLGLYENLEFLPLSPSTTSFAESLQREEALIAQLRQEIVSHHDLKEEDMHNPNMPPHGHTDEVNQWLDGTIGSNPTKPTLFRRMDEPAADDFSQLARCIRFARSASQHTTNWRIHPVHSQEMCKLTNKYGIELLRARSTLTYPFAGAKYSLEEFKLVVAIRFAKHFPDRDCTAVHVSQILESSAYRDDGLLLSRLTHVDEFLFAKYVDPIVQRYEDWREDTMTQRLY
jgi:hypothetical protein